MSVARKILFIDNFDSFTYNLVDEFSCLGADVEVYRNDVALPVLFQRAQIATQNGQAPLFVLSPGPGTPEAAGVCIPLIREALGRYPLFGVCLGHQAMVAALGGEVGRAPRAVHGQRDQITHNGHALFSGLPSPLGVGRYHSLVATRMPDVLTAIAHSGDLVMALAHRELPLAGVQFHPESILTTHGRRLLANVLQFLAVGATGSAMTDSATTAHQGETR